MHICSFHFAESIHAVVTFLHTSLPSMNIMHKTLPCTFPLFTTRSFLEPTTVCYVSPLNSNSNTLSFFADICASKVVWATVTALIPPRLRLRPRPNRLIQGQLYVYKCDICWNRSQANHISLFYCTHNWMWHHNKLGQMHFEKLTLNYFLCKNTCIFA